MERIGPAETARGTRLPPAGGGGGHSRSVSALSPFWRASRPQSPRPTIGRGSRCPRSARPRRPQAFTSRRRPPSGALSAPPRPARPVTRRSPTAPRPLRPNQRQYQYQRRALAEPEHPAHRGLLSRPPEPGIPTRQLLCVWRGHPTAVVPSPEGRHTARRPLAGDSPTGSVLPPCRRLGAGEQIRAEAAERDHGCHAADADADEELAALFRVLLVSMASMRLYPSLAGPGARLGRTVRAVG